MPTFCGRTEIRKCAHTQTIKTNGQPQKWNMRNRSATWCAIIKYDFKWLEGMHYEYTRMSFDLYLNPDSTQCVCRSKDVISISILAWHACPQFNRNVSLSLYLNRCVSFFLLHRCCICSFYGLTFIRGIWLNLLNRMRIFNRRIS